MARTYKVDGIFQPVLLLTGNESSIVSSEFAQNLVQTRGAKHIGFTKIKARDGKITTKTTLPLFRRLRLRTLGRCRLRGFSARMSPPVPGRGGKIGISPYDQLLDGLVENKAWAVTAIAEVRNA